MPLRTRKWFNYLTYCLLLIVLLVVTSVSSEDPVCSHQLNSCSCQTVTGGKIDLSPLANQNDFAFSSLGPKKSFNYLYNPCIGMRCDSSSGDSASCQRSQDRLYEYLLGTQSTARFDTKPDIGLHVTYGGTAGDGKRRQAMILLTCDPAADVARFESLDEGSIGPEPIVYRMRLTSKYCCEQSGGGGGGGGGALSGGDILLIIFFSLLFVYMVGGFAFNSLVRKQPLWPDSLPNRTVWTAMPALVRDGAVFTFNGLRSLICRKKSNYDSI